MVEAGPVRANDLVGFGASMLDGATGDPRASARSILVQLLNDPLALARNDVLRDETVTRFRDLVVRHSTGEPLQYLAGRVGFRTLDLAVDSRVLIPRPETEGLVELALSRIEAGGNDGVAALDIGTGSGCIAISLAVEGRCHKVVATDVSPGALGVAADNARLNDADAIDFRLGPFFEPVAGERFDVIVSNPPYVAPAEYRLLDRSVRDFEPRAALISDDGGLAHTGAILARAHDFLEPGGLLALEIDSQRPEQSLALALAGGWSSARIESDQFDRPRYLMAGRADR